MMDSHYLFITDENVLHSYNSTTVNGVSVFSLMCPRDEMTLPCCLYTSCISVYIYILLFFLFLHFLTLLFCKIRYVHGKHHCTFYIKSALDIKNQRKVFLLLYYLDDDTL